MEAAIFTKVVFPAPFGPMSAWIWAGSTVSETSLTAVNFPLSYVRETLRNSNAGAFESVEMFFPYCVLLKWVLVKLALKLLTFCQQVFDMSGECGKPSDREPGSK